MEGITGKAEKEPNKSFELFAHGDNTQKHQQIGEKLPVILIYYSGRLTSRWI